MALVRPYVLTTNPLVAGFAPMDWATDVTFFARDDWSSSPAREAYWPAYRDAYRRISESGRAVAAVSAEIIERIAPTGPAAVVPNGVEPSEWLGPLPAAPDWFAAIPGPRAVYVGTLDSRLDVPGIVDLAIRRPELQVVLLGPLPDPDYVVDLRPLANVHLHESVARAELVATLRNAELCLLAHRRTPLTEAMSPLKIYEYLAAGSPVIVRRPAARARHRRPGAARRLASPTSPTSSRPPSRWDGPTSADAPSSSTTTPGPPGTSRSSRSREREDRNARAPRPGGRSTAPMSPEREGARPPFVSGSVSVALKSL